METKLCFLNDKINKLNTTLDTRINDTKELFDTTKMLVDSHDTSIQNLKSTANDLYTKTEADSMFATKQELNSTVISNAVTYDNIYTRTQSDANFVSSGDLTNNYYTKSEAYSKIESDALFCHPQEGYFTKTEIDANMDLQQATDLVVKKNIVPSTNETLDLGTPTSRFKDLYLSGNTIYLGDEALSKHADGGIHVKNLLIGEGTDKLRLKVKNVNNKKILSIDDDDDVTQSSNIDIHQLSGAVTQNQQTISTLNQQIQNIQAIIS